MRAWWEMERSILRSKEMKTKIAMVRLSITKTALKIRRALVARRTESLASPIGAGPLVQHGYLPEAMELGAKRPDMPNNKEGS